MSLGSEFEALGSHIPATWDEDGLRGVGFSGFVPFRALVEREPPRRRGVYVVLREAEHPPRFVAPDAVDPAYPGLVFYGIRELEARWVQNARVIYVGVAGKPGTSAHLRSRLAQYRRTGEGLARNHSGGRSVFQLHDRDTLLVAWKAIDDSEPYDVEVAMRAAFEANYGRIPFANKQR